MSEAAEYKIFIDPCSVDSRFFYYQIIASYDRPEKSKLKIGTPYYVQKMTLL